MSESCLLMEIDPIFKMLKSFHFMFFGRYESHIQDFKKLLDGFSGPFGASLFWQKQKWRCSTFLDFQKERSERIRIFLELLYLKSFGVSITQNHWFGESWSRPLGPKIMKMETCRVLATRILKATNPKWSRIIIWRLRATFCLQFTIQIAHPTPQTPTPDFSQFVLDFLVRTHRNCSRRSRNPKRLLTSACTARSS